MVNAKKGKIISSSHGKVAAIVDPVAVNREYYQATVRTASGEYISENAHHANPTDTLRAIYNR